MLASHEKERDPLLSFLENGLFLTSASCILWSMVNGIDLRSHVFVIQHEIWLAFGHSMQLRNTGASLCLPGNETDEKHEITYLGVLHDNCSMKSHDNCSMKSHTLEFLHDNCAALPDRSKESYISQSTNLAFEAQLPVPARRSTRARTASVKARESAETAALVGQKRSRPGGEGSIEQQQQQQPQRTAASGQADAGSVRVEPCLSVGRNPGYKNVYIADGIVDEMGPPMRYRIKWQLRVTLRCWCSLIPIASSKPLGVWAKPKTHTSRRAQCNKSLHAYTGRTSMKSSIPCPWARPVGAAGRYRWTVHRWRLTLFSDFAGMLTYAIYLGK
eukprot:scaffold55137_cov15-Tisochrysis_lutea.AAC.1